MKVAITGASGTIGPSLIERLSEAAAVDRIVTLGRRQTPSICEHEGVEFRRVDVRDREAVVAAVQGADVVVHMAFALYGVRGRERELFATNVRGTGNVAAAAAAAGARRFIYTSSCAVYGVRDDNPQPLDEHAPLRASNTHFYARHKAQAELVVDEQLAGSEIERFVFRPCAIVGPHAAGVISHRLPSSLLAVARRGLRMAARAGLRPAILAPPVPMQFVHEDDVAQAIQLAVLEDPPSGVYNLGGDGAVAGERVPELLGLRRLPVPRAATRTWIKTLSAIPPVFPAGTWPELVSEPLLIDSARARQCLRWRPRWSSEQALKATRASLGW